MKDIQQQDQNKYHRRSIRLKDYDYSENGAYCITICTKQKAHYFAQYPALKHIVESEWDLVSERFSSVTTDAFVVMPNHIHGIIVLRANDVDVGAGSSPAHPTATSRAPLQLEILLVLSSQYA
jgi:hypothetical protein